METWPEQKVLIVAVNAETGERRAFDRNSGIDLVDAVIATTASFGWPPTLFQGQHYIDGGFYSSDNADLATGCDRVMVLGLQPPPMFRTGVCSLDAGVKKLQTAVFKLRPYILMKTPRGARLGWRRYEPGDIRAGSKGWACAGQKHCERAPLVVLAVEK